MGKRVLFVLVVVLIPLLWVFPAAHAQDVIITNLAQLADEAFSANHSIYLPGSTPWQWGAYSTDGGEPFWVDCSQLPCADLLPASTDRNGVPLLSGRLTKNVLTGTLVGRFGSIRKVFDPPTL